MNQYTQRCLVSLTREDETSSELNLSTLTSMNTADTTTAMQACQTKGIQRRKKRLLFNKVDGGLPGLRIIGDVGGISRYREQESEEGRMAYSVVEVEHQCRTLDVAGGVAGGVPGGVAGGVRVVSGVRYAV